MQLNISGMFNLGDLFVGPFLSLSQQGDILHAVSHRVGGVVVVPGGRHSVSLRVVINLGWIGMWNGLLKAQLF